MYIRIKSYDHREVGNVTITRCYKQAGRSELTPEGLGNVASRCEQISVYAEWGPPEQECGLERATIELVALHDISPEEFVQALSQLIKEAKQMVGTDTVWTTLGHRVIARMKVASRLVPYENLDWMPMMTDAIKAFEAWHPECEVEEHQGHNLVVRVMERMMSVLKDFRVRRWFVERDYRVFRKLDGLCEKYIPEHEMYQLGRDFRIIDLGRKELTLDWQLVAPDARRCDPCFVATMSKGILELSIRPVPHSTSCEIELVSYHPACPASKKVFRHRLTKDFDPDEIGRRYVDYEIGAGMKVWEDREEAVIYKILRGLLDWELGGERDVNIVWSAT